MAIEHADQFYIDGRWQTCTTSARTPVTNPASEQLVGHIASGAADEVDQAVAAARKAFSSFSQMSVEKRLALLGRVLELIQQRAELFVDAMVTEMGAAITFARASQVPFAVEHVRVAIEVLREYPFLRVNGTTATAKEAIGVCALITPWNWPLYQITAKVAPAIAAGCTVVLKPSELSPYSALLFAQVMHDAGVPAGVFNMINGTGEVVGATLAAHPDVDMISITGSTRAGVLVAQAAAPTVKRVVQELGGKYTNPTSYSYMPISNRALPRACSQDSAMSASRAARRLGCWSRSLGSPKWKNWRQRRQPTSAWAIPGSKTRRWVPLPMPLNISACRR